jgi:RecA-family ATPase
MHNTEIPVALQRPEKPVVEPPLFCTGRGQFDTRSVEVKGKDGQFRPNTHLNAGKDYDPISASEILALVENPPSVVKEEGRWVIPSTYIGPDARTHSVQREKGQFWLLPLDVDTGNLSIGEVDAALVKVCGAVPRAIYSTRSATADNRKWRAFVALSRPLAGSDYADTVAAFNDLLREASGGRLVPDTAICHPGQLVYLPNRGAYYRRSIVRGGASLSLAPSHPIIVKREANRAARAEIERQAADDHEARKARRSTESGGIVGEFNDRHEIGDLLLKYGYEPECELGGCNWRSPYQTTNSFATWDRGSHWISLSGSDAEAGLGRAASGGAARFGDAFDLFVNFVHGGNFGAAVKAYAAELGLTVTRAGPDILEHFTPLPDDAEATSSLFFSASDLEGREAPARDWIVPYLVPNSTVTLFSGDGGTGKSLLSLQLAVAVASGGNWLGFDLAQGAAVFLSAEDDQDEIHRRLQDVTHAAGVAWGDLGGLKLASLAGEDALLAAPRSGSLTKTPLLDRLDTYLSATKPRIAILDTSADLYGGDEINRAQVRQFIGMLRGLAIRHACAVVLLSHPSVAGMDSGSGISGSTAWNNSVRSRLYLERVKVDKVECDPNARRLSSKKSNYGPVGPEIMLRWQAGAFVPVAGGGKGLAAEARADAERVFLKCLALMIRTGQRVNSASGANYAPSRFVAMEEAGGVSKKALRGAMDALLARGEICIAEEGPPSKRSRFLTIQGET